jgi:hypothetical protein
MRSRTQSPINANEDPKTTILSRSTVIHNRNTISSFFSSPRLCLLVICKKT